MTAVIGEYAFLTNIEDAERVNSLEDLQKEARAYYTAIMRFYKVKFVTDTVDWESSYKIELEKRKALELKLERIKTMLLECVITSYSIHYTKLYESGT